MSNRAWMPLHIEEYLADTDHLSATEHGAYLLLIMKYWREGGLPSDEALIRRYAKLTPEQWAESRDVLAAYFDVGWCHKRIDAEIAKAGEIIEKRRNAANRRHAKSTSPACAEQVHSKCSDTGALPLTTNLSDSATALSSSPEPEKSAPAVVELPCTSDQTYPVSEADIAEWCKAFPAVDVPQQLSAMLQWLIANPTRRKTKRGARKFIVGWLDRRQNSAMPPARGHSPPRQSLGEFFREDARRQRLIPDDTTDKPTGYLEAGDGSRQDAGSGGARVFAVSGDILGKLG